MTNTGDNVMDLNENQVSALSKECQDLFKKTINPYCDWIAGQKGKRIRIKANLFDKICGSMARIKGEKKQRYVSIHYRNAEIIPDTRK